MVPLVRDLNKYAEGKNAFRRRLNSHGGLNPRDREEIASLLDYSVTFTLTPLTKYIICGKTDFQNLNVHVGIMLEL